MDQWQQFLSGQAALPHIAGIESLAGGFVTPLTHLGLMKFSGEDAAKFLHSQLTNDVEHLGQEEARLAGYCSPKGRLLATFLMWRSADGILLQCSADIQPAAQKRLQMFIMRAKAKAGDATPDTALIGVAGKAAEKRLAEWFPSIPATPYAKAESPFGTLIRVADANGVPRYEWVADIAQAEAAWPKLAADLPPLDPAAWRLADILAGVPQVVLATQEQFVPQMVNYEVIGGVNFKKGCYPGQEIVARSQYLGKLKRRMVLATAAAMDVEAGTELYSSTDPDQPCGMVVNAERMSNEESALLAEVKISATESGSIHLGSAGGPNLLLQPLPYALPEAA